MKYYAKELSVNQNVKNTAGVKARDDLDMILDQAGYSPLAVYSCRDKQYSGAAKKLKKQLDIYNAWVQASAPLRQGDVLFVQYPVKENSFLLPRLFRSLKRKGVVLLLLVHDLSVLRLVKQKDVGLAHRANILFTEMPVLKTADHVIAHNEIMCGHLAALGVEKSCLIPLEIFDYLIPDFDPARRAGKTGRDRPVIIAGNLRPVKSGYAYHLPENCAFNLYGIDYSGTLPAGSTYFGAFPPDEVPYAMEGSFGLVWDGDSAETCTGIFGEYLKINNPHKTSLYLASGIPVAIWKQAALANYVVKNKAGIAVDSLSELRAAIDQLSEADYAEMAKNAENIGRRLRDGAFTKAALEKAAL